LGREDLFTVVHEQMMTDTARYADWVLPAAMSLEALDLHISYWHHYIQLSEKAVDPPGESVSNTEFFRRMARAVGFGSAAWTQDSDEMLIRQALDTTHPWLEGITLESLRENPVQKVRIEAAERPLLDGAGIAFRLDPLPVAPFQDPAGQDGYPYVLLTPSRKNTIKSSFANIPQLMRDEPEPMAYMHPQDAARAHLSSGQMVRLYSAQGSIVLRLQTSDAVQIGVLVSYAVRWNYESGGVNINSLTSQRLSDYGGGSTFYSTWVNIEALAETRMHKEG
jgi:anaerobic selenocysteine-containing dehydrogenase